jgi:DnaK suppressor protein
MEISVARKRLEEMRDDLERTLLVLQGEHPLVRGGSAEPGDAGANLTEADRNAASVQTAQAQRAEVLAALARVDDGSYGRCVDCGNPVPDARLEARPATPRCVPCQSKRDRRRLPRGLSFARGDDQLVADGVVGAGAEFRAQQLLKAARVAGKQVADRARREHRAGADPAHVEAAGGEQLA